VPVTFLPVIFSTRDIAAATRESRGGLAVRWSRANGCVDSSTHLIPKRGKNGEMIALSGVRGRLVGSGGLIGRLPLQESGVPPPGSSWRMA
jgi:hypothetical protein